MGGRHLTASAQPLAVPLWRCQGGNQASGALSVAQHPVRAREVTLSKQILTITSAEAPDVFRTLEVEPTLPILTVETTSS